MKTVLEREVKILPENNKTNIVLPFETETAEMMKITYSYSPKNLEDGERARALIEECLKNDTGEYRSEYPDWTAYLPLKNLITLSLGGSRRLPRRGAQTRLGAGSYSVGEKRFRRIL